MSPVTRKIDRGRPGGRPGRRFFTPPGRRSSRAFWPAGRIFAGRPRLPGTRIVCDAGGAEDSGLLALVVVVVVVVEATLSASSHGLAAPFDESCSLPLPGFADDVSQSSNTFSDDSADSFLFLDVEACTDVSPNAPPSGEMSSANSEAA